MELVLDRKLSEKTCIPGHRHSEVRNSEEKIYCLDKEELASCWIIMRKAIKRYAKPTRQWKTF